MEYLHILFVMAVDSPKRASPTRDFHFGDPSVLLSNLSPFGPLPQNYYSLTMMLLGIQDDGR